MAFWQSKREYIDKAKQVVEKMENSSSYVFDKENTILLRLGWAAPIENSTNLRPYIKLGTCIIR